MLKVNIDLKDGTGQPFGRLGSTTPHRFGFALSAPRGAI